MTNYNKFWMNGAQWHLIKGKWLVKDIIMKFKKPMVHSVDNDLQQFQGNFIDQRQIKLYYFKIYQMSLSQDPQFIQFVKTHPRVVLPIGTVFVVKFTESFPPGARRMTSAQGQQYFQQLKTIMQQWSIIAFDQGAISGSGYNYAFKQSFGQEVGQGFIVIQGQYN